MKAKFDEALATFEQKAKLNDVVNSQKEKDSARKTAGINTKRTSKQSDKFDQQSKTIRRFNEPLNDGTKKMVP